MSNRANDYHSHRGNYFAGYQDRLAKHKAINPFIFEQLEDVEAEIKHHTVLSHQTYGFGFDNHIDYDGASAYYIENIRPLEHLLHNLFNSAYCNHKNSIDDGYRDICTCGAVNYGGGWFYQQEVSHASTVTYYAVA